MIFRPIERDSEVVPAARFVADFPVNRREGVQHLLHHSRQVDILQPMGDVLDGASDVSFNQIDDFGGDRREPLDALFEVEKDGADLGAGQQILLVRVRLGELFEFSLQLRVHGKQFFVDRAQLLLRSEQLLVGGLQLLHCRAELLVAGLQLFVGGLQHLPGRCQLLFEHGRALQQRSVRHRDRIGVICPPPGSHFFEQHQQSAWLRRLAGQRTHAEVDHQRLAVSFQAQTAVADLFFSRARLPDGRTQMDAEILACQPCDIQIGLTGGCFQKPSGLPVHVEHVSGIVDHHAGWRIQLQQSPFGHFTQRRLVVAADLGSLDDTAQTHRLEESGIGQSGIPRLGFRPPLIEMQLAIELGKQILRCAGRLRTAKQQIAALVQRIVEQSEDPRLQLGFHVDQQVAAGNKIHARERRILDHIVTGEDQHPAQLLADDVSTFIFAEETGQTLLGDIADDALRIDPGARDLECRLIDVGGEDLYVVRRPGMLKVFVNQHGDGVDLLAG